MIYSSMVLNLAHKLGLEYNNNNSKVIIMMIAIQKTSHTSYHI